MQSGYVRVVAERSCFVNNNDNAIARKTLSIFHDGYDFFKHVNRVKMVIIIVIARYNKKYNTYCMAASLA